MKLRRVQSYDDTDVNGVRILWLVSTICGREEVRRKMHRCPTLYRIKYPFASQYVLRSIMIFRSEWRPRTWDLFWEREMKESKRFEWSFNESLQLHRPTLCHLVFMYRVTLVSLPFLFQIRSHPEICFSHV